MLDFEPMKDFPALEVPVSGKLKPKSLDYGVLKEAVRKTHEKISRGEWQVKQGRAFLKALAINKDLRCRVTDNAWNAHQLALSVENKDKAPLEHGYLADQFNENPQSFTMVELPVLWCRGVLLKQHVDVIMHLVFLGVLKTSIIQFNFWAKKKGKHRSFVRHAEGVLESIQALGLKWCKAIPYSSGKLGGWVSENYLALSRVIKWFYSRLDHIADDKKFVQPCIPQKKWVMDDNKGWLRERGQPLSGNAAELRERVHNLMTQKGGPPSIVPPGGGPVENVMRCSRALSCMVSKLMVNQVTPGHVFEAQRAVKLFLSIFEEFDSHM